MGSAISIKLISHASILIKTSDVCILTDPWFFSKVFNNSWTLYPKAAWSEKYLDDISHIWISHEHLTILTFQH